MLRFKKTYFLLTIFLFIIELLIALYIHDNFIRPTIGDLLVVILIYCFLMTFLNLKYWATSIFVLLFAYLVEILQYFHIVELLGLQNNKLMVIVIGNSFSWKDLIAYLSGVLIIIAIETLVERFYKKAITHKFED